MKPGLLRLILYQLPCFPLTIAMPFNTILDAALSHTLPAAAVAVVTVLLTCWYTHLVLHQPALPFSHQQFT